MSTEAILFGAACVLLYLTITIQLRELRGVRRLRDLCRRCAEHLSDECHDGIRDINTHLELWREFERAGWTKGGKER